MLALPPTEFQFHPEDQPRYGDGWHRYDEVALLRTPIALLIEIERTVGMSVLSMIDRMRAGYADAYLAVSWSVLFLEGVKRDFETFDPLVMLMAWRPVPKEEASLPLEEVGDSSSSPESTVESPA